MNRRPDLWTVLLRALGLPAWLLLRFLGLRVPVTPAQGSADPNPEGTAPGDPPEGARPAEDGLPPGWTRPREMAEVKPTLAPVTLALGLAGATLGLLVGAWSVVGLSGLIALFGGGLWAWDAYQETR